MKKKKNNLKTKKSQDVSAENNKLLYLCDYIIKLDQL